MKIRTYTADRRSNWLPRSMGSGVYRSWLLDKGSLTQRLQAVSKKFSVQLRKLKHARAQVDEAYLLEMPSYQYALLREVYLCCENQPVVFAHSVLPHRSLRGRWHGLSRLGGRSLGSALFANARISRTHLEFRKLTRTHPLYRQAVAGMQQAPRQLWARRSVFRLKHASILVTEVFLPQVLSL